VYQLHDFVVNHQLAQAITGVKQQARVKLSLVLGIGQEVHSMPPRVAHLHVQVLFGVQVRDEHRTDYDQGRGGYGQLMWQEIEQRQVAAVGQADIDANPAYGRQEYQNTRGGNAGRKRPHREFDTYQPQNKNPRARDDDDD